LTVRDATNNVIPTQAVSLASSGTGNTLTPASGTTDASGVFTATLASTNAETKTVTATMGAVNVTTTASFVAGAAVTSASLLTASPNSVADDGVSTSTLSVTARDINNNLISGQSVTFRQHGLEQYVSSTSATTNGSGNASVTLKSTLAETKTVTATMVAPRRPRR